MSATLPGSVPRRDAEIIGLVGLAHGTSHFFHLMLPPLFPWLMKDFALSYTDVGLLTTTFFVVSGIGQALAGFVVDRVGARRVLFFGIGALSFSGILLGLSTSYPMLLLTAAVAGAGNSIFHPADFTLLNSEIAPSRLGHAFSVHGLSGSLGWAAAPVFMAGTASLAGWHVAGFAIAGVGAVVLTLLWFRRGVLEQAAAELVVAARGKSEPSKPSAQLAFLSSGAVWLCFAFFFLTTAAFGILQNYAPAILSRVYGVSLVFASGGLTAYLLGSAVGMITGGFLASRGDRIVTIALAGAASDGHAPCYRRRAPFCVVAADGSFGIWRGDVWPTPRFDGATRGDEPLWQNVVRTGLRLRVFGVGHRSCRLASALWTAARRRPFPGCVDCCCRVTGVVLVHGAAGRQHRSRDGCCVDVKTEKLELTSQK